MQVALRSKIAIEQETEYAAKLLLPILNSHWVCGMQPAREPEGVGASSRDRFPQNSQVFLLNRLLWKHRDRPGSVTSLDDLAIRHRALPAFSNDGYAKVIMLRVEELGPSLRGHAETQVLTGSSVRRRRQLFQSIGKTAGRSL